MSDWDRQTTPGGVEGPQWVSAAEAADVAGVTPGTVRYWARNGLIVSEVVEGPAGEKTLVRLDEVLQHARQETPSHAAPSPRHAAPGPTGSEVVTDLPARTSELAPILKSIPEIMAQLTSATDRAARAETKVEFLSAQLADLRRRLAEAEAGAGAEAPSVVTLPEEWEPAAETPSAETTATEWPAPAPETLRDEPADEVREPGPESIDWTTRDEAAAPTTSDAEPEAAVVDWTSRDDDGSEASPAPAAAPPATESGSEYSLSDIWNQPAPQAPAPAEPEPEDPAGVDWHEPAGGSEPAAGEPSAPPRKANATFPDDDFYGPRRRRWFRRR